MASKFYLINPFFSLIKASFQLYSIWCDLKTKLKNNCLKHLHIIISYLSQSHRALSHNL